MTGKVVIVKMTRIYILLVCLFFSALNAFAETKVLLSSDRRDIVAGDIFSVQLIIDGETDAELLEIENLNMFQVEGQSTSSSYKYINGKSSKEKVIKYDLSLINNPSKKSIFIGPAVVEVNGKKVKSNYLAFNVGSTNGPKKSGQKNNIKEQNLYFLKVQVEEDELFVNQKTMLTLKFYNAVDFAEANLVTPESKEFWLEQSGKQQNSREIINGRAYKVTTVKYFFTPLVVGKIDINGFAIKGLAILPDESTSGRRGRRSFGLDSFFDDSFFRNRGKRRRVNLVAPTVTLKVEGVPNDQRQKFDGVVGQFKAKELDWPSKIDASDSLVFSFIVSGDGNLNLLEFSYDSNDFKVFKDKDEGIVLPGGELQEARRLSYLLVPKKAGGLKIPVFSAKYFDPSDKLFKELRIGGGDLSVTGEVKTISSASQGKQTTSSEINPFVKEKVKEVKDTKNIAVVSILEKRIEGNLAGFLLRNSRIFSWVALITFIFGLSSSLFRVEALINRMLAILNIKKKTKSKEVSAFLRQIRGNNLSVKDIDYLVELVLEERFSILRDENFGRLRKIGIDEKHISDLMKIYSEIEASNFSNKNIVRKLEKKDKSLFVQMAKKSDRGE